MSENNVSKKAFKSITSRNRDVITGNNDAVAVTFTEYVVREPFKPKSTKTTNKKRKANRKHKNRK